MKNKEQEKALKILYIIFEAFDEAGLPFPKGSTIGDVCLALSIIDETGYIEKVLKTSIRDAVICEIKSKLAIED